MWPDSQEIADLVTFNEEAYMENFIFLCVCEKFKLSISLEKIQERKWCKNDLGRLSLRTPVY